MALIKAFADGSFLEYGRGSFDDWCVYLTKPSGQRRPPRDVDYFQQIKNFAEKYGAQRVYDDYALIYGKTTKQVDPAVLQYITDIADSYEPMDTLEVDILFSILYMAMIAEEQKTNTRLGRRIKRLGVYYLLFEGADIHQAANFMRGMGGWDIAVLCEKRGF